MISIPLTFTVEQAVAVFRNVGLVVEIKEVKTYFERHHRPGYFEYIPVWIVVNPHTGEDIPLKECFREFIENRKIELFLQPDKLQIFNLFENGKKEIPTTV